MFDKKIQTSVWIFLCVLFPRNTLVLEQPFLTHALELPLRGYLCWAKYATPGLLKRWGGLMRWVASLLLGVASQDC